MNEIAFPISWSDDEITPEQRLDAIWGDPGRMEYEPCVVFDTPGDRPFTLVAHGQADGQFRDEEWVYQVMAHLGGSQNCRIVCCYPALVAERHPELDIVGDWSITSTARIEQDDDGRFFLVILPAGW